MTAASKMARQIGAQISADDFVQRLTMPIPLDDNL